MIDYESKTINELMGMYNPIFEAREDCCSVDYNELFCDWLYGLINYIEDSQPEPKYAIDDIVWRLNDEEGVTKCRIFEIDLASDEMYCCEDDEVSGAWWLEEQLYPTRRAAIESQLWHWTRMMADEVHKPKASCCSVHTGGHEECRVECVHEPSASKWVSPADMIEKFKCKKCGEFYR